MKTQATDWAKKVWGDFKAFKPGQKAVTLAAIGALIVGGILFASWKTSPDYAPLYSNLSSTDAAAIVQQLSDNGVDYKLADNGHQILVPKDTVYNTRLQMSSDGLPASTSGGYALLDKEGITTSDFKQQVDFQRAIEGELEKTIDAMDGVKDASVHLAIPQKNVFNDGTKKTTAAVMLTLAPGASVSDSQVRSVVYLVSSSVPELKPENVTVADASGKVLSAPGDKLDGVGASDARTKMTKAYDQRVASSLQDMLTTALGPGHAVVTVNAVLDFDETSTKTQDYTYKPDTPPVWSEDQTETYQGTGSSDGVFGTGEPAEDGGTAKDGQDGKYNKSNKTVSNALGTVTKNVKNTPGSVKKLSVAVLLDKDAKNVDVPGIRKLVTSAAGLNTNRGDSLAIQAMAFDTSAQDAAAAQQKAADKAAADKASEKQLHQWIREGVIAGLILTVLIITLISSKRRKKHRELDEPVPESVDLMTHVPDESATAPPPVAEPEPIMVADGNAGRRALLALADEKPDDVARVLSGWLGTSEPAGEGAQR